MTSDMSRRPKKPRLLIVGPLPPPFIGPAVATKRLIESPYLQRYFDLDLLDASDRDGLDGIGSLDWNNIRQALRHGAGFLRALLRRRPDAVYVSIARGFWGFVRDLLFIVPSRALGVPVVVHLRAGRFDLMHDDGAPGRLVGRIGMACVSRGVVLSEGLRGIFGALLPKDRISVVPNGMPPDDLLRALPLPPADRDDGGFDIACISNLFHDKGIHIMIEAVPAIRAVVPNVRVRFAGRWLDAGYERDCRDLVERLGVGAQVEFIGSVDGDGKRRLLAASDAVAFVPVAPEGLPWVVLEAMSAGRPVVGTPQGAMSEVIVPGETGILVRPGSPAEVAEALIRLASDRVAIRRMGAVGRERVERVYSEEAAHTALAEVILATARRS